MGAFFMLVYFLAGILLYGAIVWVLKRFFDIDIDN